MISSSEEKRQHEGLEEGTLDAFFQCSCGFLKHLKKKWPWHFMPMGKTSKWFSHLFHSIQKLDFFYRFYPISTTVRKFNKKVFNILTTQGSGTLCKANVQDDTVWSSFQLIL